MDLTIKAYLPVTFPTDNTKCLSVAAMPAPLVTVVVLPDESLADLLARLQLASEGGQRVTGTVRVAPSST